MHTHLHQTFNPSQPYAGLKTPLELFVSWEKTRPNDICIRQPMDGKWLTLTWKEAGEEVRRMAAVLRQMNLPQGSHIAILSKNCSYWLLADLAIMLAGHVSVPMYPNLTAKSVRQILEHSETKVCFTGKLDDFESMRAGIPDNVRCITFPIYAQSGVEQWSDLCAKVQPVTDDGFVQLDDFMTIIYTSGTTGEPKGVMHKYQNLAFATTYALQIFKEVRANTRFFSYLPLCHIAERVVVEMAWLYSGGMVSFAESLELFAKNLQQTNPHIFLAVPRIWTKFQMAILDKMPQNRLSLLLKIPFINTIIKNKIKKGLGLAEAHYVLTGAAPIAPSLLEWYKKLDINILEGYAMTENSAYSHFTLPGATKFGTVGQNLPHSNVRISEDGEIQVKNPCILNGYYKNRELTEETITPDGYLRTGDTGEVDKDGYLKITGRLKEIFKTEKGKYVAPAPLEMELYANTHLEQICVVGSNTPQPIALVVLSAAAREESKEDLIESLTTTLSHVNENTDKFARLQCLVVLKEDWTVENGLLTPTLKIKRNVVDERFSKHYPTWYNSGQAIVWADI